MEQAQRLDMPARTTIAESPVMRPSELHRVVIIGGGFGGLCAARSFASAPVQLTLIDRRNFHLFQPLLYQVATGWLSPANISSTLRAVLSRQKNARVLLAEVTDFDAERREVISSAGNVAYDTLIVATGSTHHYFGHDEWENQAPSLKSVEDATEIRRRIFSAFERAEWETDPAAVRALLTFVVVGGGPTGVELAGALADVAKRTLKNDFRHIDPADAQIILLEAAPCILTTYPKDLAAKAETFLKNLGVSVKTRSAVTDLRSGEVVIKRDETTQRIASHTVLWAAGVRASSLGKALARATGARLDRAGRVFVDQDFALPNHPEIFVIGDLANYSSSGDAPLPGVAPVAQQAGRYVAKLVACRLRGKNVPAFHYRDRGTMAIIGRRHAVADFGRFHLAGFFAWLTWLFVHLMQLVEFQNRVLVLVQWGWYYLRRSRAARLITGDFSKRQ
jgi:NADH:ubiquinone reductase (H+-translocating)